MSEIDQMASFVGLVVMERYKQRRRAGMEELDAVALAAYDAWGFLESLAAEPTLDENHNAVLSLKDWLKLEEVVVNE